MLQFPQNGEGELMIYLVLLEHTQLSPITNYPQLSSISTDITIRVEDYRKEQGSSQLTKHLKACVRNI